MKHSLLIGALSILIASSFAVQAQPSVKDSVNNDKEVTKTSPELLAQATQPADDATSVKVIVQKKQTIEEYRQKGELVLVKVIPNDGVPYYIDPLERQKNTSSGKDLINAGVKPVRWVIKEF